MVQIYADDELVRATCNNCRKITDVVFQEKKHPNKIREGYFECEHCYHHYTTYVTDAWVRKRIKKIKGLRLLSVKEGASIDNDHLGREIKQIQNEIKFQMSKLKHNLIVFGKADL